MTKNWLLAFVAALTAGVVGYALGRQTDFDLEIKSGDKSAALKVKGSAVDYEDILRTIYENDFLKGAARQWLVDNHNIVAISDERLAHVLREKSCGEIPNEPEQARLSALKACADAAGNKQLRALALEEHGPPFHRVGRPTRLSVPERQPSKGSAAVCDPKLFGQRIEIFNAAQERSIFVNATGQMECSKLSDSGTQMHISADDAEELLGRTNTKGIHDVWILED